VVKFLVLAEFLVSQMWVGSNELAGAVHVCFWAELSHWRTRMSTGCLRREPTFMS